MTLEAVAALRAEMWDAGYRPVPIKNHNATCSSPGKKPGGPNYGEAWQEEARKDPPTALHWRDAGELNTGILCDGLRALDIDLEDAQIVARVRAVAVFMFGETITRYRDNSARCLLVYRAAVGEPAKRRLVGPAGKIEILGKGNQFVAYGLHPTGAELRWRPEGPQTASCSSLPTITEEQIARFFAEIGNIIGGGKEDTATETQRESSAEVRGLIDALNAADAGSIHGPADLLEPVVRKLDGALADWELLRARWAGNVADLSAKGRDTSRSGRDMSLAAMLKGSGFNPIEAAMVLLAYEHGAAWDTQKHPSAFTRLRYVSRTVLRCATAFKPLKFFREQPSENGEPSTEAPKENVVRGMSEDEMAVAFADMNDGRLAFDHTDNQWFIWRGDRWKRDETGLAFDLARDFVREVRDAADDAPKSLSKVSFVSAIERGAKHDRRMAVSHEVWDRDAWILGVPGGSVDLRDGKMLSGDPCLYVSKQAAVAPAAPGTPCPMWQRFLVEATNGDAELQAFLQRLAGYLLTGDVSEEVLVFIYGPGGNGKGVYVGTLTGILEDYAVATPIEAFTASSHLNLEYYRAQMVGARLVTASETEAGAAWRESQIKELTGNEAPLSARRPYGSPFTFRSQFKLTIVGNHAPRLRGRSPAMERRLRVVPFIHQPSDPDPYLKDKLRAEYPAILRWMIDGCLLWQRERLGTAQVIQTATESYFEQQDAFGRWLEEGCILASHLRTPAGEAYAAFKAWCVANGEEAPKVQEFAELVERNSALARVKVKGKTFVSGLGLQVEQQARYGD